MRIAPAIALSLLAACGTPGGSAPDASTSDASAAGAPGAIHVTWHVQNAGSDAACPPGATLAVVSVQGTTGAPTSTTEPCEAGSADIAGLDPGDYSATVSLSDDTRSQLFARSPGHDVLVSPGVTAPVDIPFDGYNGFLHASWVLQANGGTPTTCAAVTNSGVTVFATSPTYGQQDIFDCTAGESPASVDTSHYMPIGDYTVTVSVIDGNNNPIGSSIAVPITIGYGNQFADLGTVTITLQ